MSTYGKSVTKALIDFIELAVIGLALVFLVYVFAGQPLRVTGESMSPNFHDGEQIIAEKISVKTGDLSRGEIVIFEHPEDPNKLLIKRVIALPGETIRISEGSIYINDGKLEEPYLDSTLRTLPGKTIHSSEGYIVPTGHYVLMGDNRSNSTDSREWGAVNRTSVVGKGFLIYYPLSNFRLIGYAE